MNNQKTWEERFKHIIEFNTSSDGQGYGFSGEDDLVEFIRSEKELSRQELFDEIILELDELEMRQPEEMKTDNWRNWKYIRNSLRDWFSELEGKNE